MDEIVFIGIGFPYYIRSVCAKIDSFRIAFTYIPNQSDICCAGEIICFYPEGNTITSIKIKDHILESHVIIRTVELKGRAFNVGINPVQAGKIGSPVDGSVVPVARIVTKIRSVRASIIFSFVEIPHSPGFMAEQSLDLLGVGFTLSNGG